MKVYSGYERVFQINEPREAQKELNEFLEKWLKKFVYSKAIAFEEVDE